MGGGMPERVLYLNLKTPSVIRHSQLAGFRRYASARGWEVVAVPDVQSRPERVPHLLAQYAPIGCAVDCTGISTRLPPSVFRGLPVVYLGSESGSYRGVPHVESDNPAIAQVAFRALAAGRPTAFAAVGHRNGTAWSRSRTRAFGALARKNGAAFRSFPVVRGESAGNWTRRLAAWLAALPRGSAVFAVSDHVAAAVVGAARLARRAIPRDFTLLGVDDIPKICERCRPPLSSVRFDHERSGFRAARMLDALLRGRSAPDAAGNVPPLLVVRRASTRGTGRMESAVLFVLDAIRREACDGLSAARAASRVPGSRRLLEMRFRDAIGHSILDEIHEVRLEKVQTLLARPDLPVKAISDFCGFKSYETLHRAFRARTGMSMARWRRNHFG